MAKVKAFVKNDRGLVGKNIAALHGMVAVLTQQPAIALNPQEAGALTTALCDVLDYHQINICGEGGPYGLYASLAVTAFMIYKPRIDVLTGEARIVAVAPTAAASPAEAAARAATRPQGGMMDFSAAA